MPPKRGANGAPKPSDTFASSSSSSSSSPITAAFSFFRAELDEHHDRRERIVKASRDITALSKKIIFSLQRHRALGRPLSSALSSEIVSRKADISALLTSLIPDLSPSVSSPLNAERYQRAISPGLQELVEAAVFERYLVSQQLLSLAETRASLLPDQLQSLLTEGDYLLGVYDATGEIMRFAITGMATGGRVPSGPSGDEIEQQQQQEKKLQEQSFMNSPRNVLTDLRELRAALEGLDVGGGGGRLARDCEAKARVMRQSVEKVESAVYGLMVRGKERPPGWLPDAREEASHTSHPAAVEGY